MTSTVGNKSFKKDYYINQPTAGTISNLQMEDVNELTYLGLLLDGLSTRNHFCHGTWSGNDYNRICKKLTPGMTFQISTWNIFSLSHEV